ncbi:MAG: hypothetical protein IJ558_05715 [Treponema sp.]|nr:hypothetical protein [Treponema sp.]
MKIGRKKSAFFLLLSLMSLLCSCMSTREYIKTQKTLYEDDIAVEESYELTRDKKLIESKSKKFYDLADVCSDVESNETTLTMRTFTAIKETNSKSENDSVTFSLMEYQADKATNEIQSFILGAKVVKVKNGKVTSTTDPNGGTHRATGDTFSNEMEKFFDENLDNLVNYMFSPPELSDENSVAPPSQNKKQQEITSAEKVVVESVPNGNYIFYSIVGKPFVILGVTTWNLIKCAGYAFINFAGGYNAVAGKNDRVIWMMPSYKKSRAKADAAKEANKIEHYPEYHLPFTNNHITVEKYDRDISVLTLADENAEEITPIERYEYDNTMSVERSASADAASTAAVAGVIGTVVTIPVSAVTWVGGAASGIYFNKK